MTVNKKVKLRHEYINVAQKTLISEYFSGKLCQMLFEINKF